MRKKALVVEDDAETQRLLVELLADSGCLVDIAADGDVAMEMLSRTDYDVVLLDIVLPRVSGAEVMDYLALVRPDALAKVIVVTGLNVEEIRRLFPSVAYTLGKPVVARRLMQSVAVCLSASDGEFTQR